jgi:peroxiredoxin
MPSPLKPGDPAPDFTLKDQHGTDWKLSDALKKGDVVLSFIRFAFTGVCSTEMGCISKDIATWSKSGATVVGICCDSPFTNKAWAQQEGFQHAILSDLHRSVCKAYGLYWADMNVAQRGTVIIAKAADGNGKIKHFEARPPSEAMNWTHVLSKL